MKNPYHNPNPQNWWHGDEMFTGLEASVDDVLTAISDPNYVTPDGHTRKDWLAMLDDDHIKDKIIIWLAQHYWFDEVKEPMKMLRQAIKDNLEA